MPPPPPPPPPQVSSVDDGQGCAGQGLPPASSWSDLVGDVKYQWDTQNSMLFHVCKSFFLFLSAVLFGVLSLETFKMQYLFIL